MTANARPPAAWQQFAGVLGFPLQGEIFGMLVGCALVRLLSHTLASSLQVQWLPDLSVQGDSSAVFSVVLGGLIDLAIAMMVLKLAVEALLNTAHDRIGPGKAGGVSANDSQALGQIGLLLIFGLPIYLLALWGSIDLGWLALLVGLGVLPAAIMLHAVDENLLHALDPRAWWELLSRLGTSYFIMVGCLLCLLLAVLGAQWATRSVLPALLNAPVSAFIGFYALLVAYHLMGRVIVQQHEALGLDLTPPIVRPRLGNAEEDEVMQLADHLLANDEPTAAADALLALIDRRGTSAPVHQRYREILQANGDSERLIQHARSYISVLLALGQPKQAAALWVESRSRDPNFQLDAPEHITALIAHAAATGQSQMAVDLAAGFNTRFRKDPDIPRNLLTAARLMAERFGRADEARHLLEGLLETYPEHPLSPEIALALAEIARMPASR